MFAEQPSIFRQNSPEVSECCVSVESDTDYGFYKIFSYKTVPENSTDVVEIGLSGSKAASDLFNLMLKEFIKLIRKRHQGSIWGKHSIFESAHHLTVYAEEFLIITTVYKFMAETIFLSLTDHV